MRGNISDSFKVTSYPNLYVIDQTGVSSVHVGYGEGSLAEIIGNINALLAKPSTAPAPATAPEPAPAPETSAGYGPGAAAGSSARSISQSSLGSSPTTKTRVPALAKPDFS